MINQRNTQELERYLKCAWRIKFVCRASENALVNQMQAAILVRLRTRLLLMNLSKPRLRRRRSVDGCAGHQNVVYELAQHAMLQMRLAANLSDLLESSSQFGQLVQLIVDLA